MKKYRKNIHGKSHFKHTSSHTHILSHTHSLSLSHIHNTVLSVMCTFCLILKELVDLGNCPVVRTHHETMVVHVQNDILTLCVERERENVCVPVRNAFLVHTCISIRSHDVMHESHTHTQINIYPGRDSKQIVQDRSHCS